MHKIGRHTKYSNSYKISNKVHTIKDADDKGCREQGSPL